MRKLKSAQVRPDVEDGVMRPARNPRKQGKKQIGAKMKVNATIDLKQLAADLPEFAKQLELLTNAHGANVYDPKAEGANGEQEREYDAKVQEQCLKAQGASVEQELQHDAKVHDANAAVTQIHMTSNGVNVHSATSQKGEDLSRAQRFEKESRTAARARARLEKQERIASELGLINILPDFDAVAAARAAKKSIAERRIFKEEWEKIMEDREMDFLLRNSPQIDGGAEPASCEADPMHQTIAEIGV